MTRWRPTTIELYAAALYDREQILDRCEIRYESFKHSGYVVGDLARVWSLLANHSRRHGVPFRPESLDLTNRDHAWEILIASDALWCARFRRAYAAVLVRGRIRLVTRDGVAIDESASVDA